MTTHALTQRDNRNSGTEHAASTLTTFATATRLPGLLLDIRRNPLTPLSFTDAAYLHPHNQDDILVACSKYQPELVIIRFDDATLISKLVDTAMATQDALPGLRFCFARHQEWHDLLGYYPPPSGSLPD